MITAPNTTYQTQFSVCPVCEVATPYHGQCCLGCAVFGTTGMDLSPALDLRMFNAPLFGVEWLSDWLKHADSSYYYINLDLNTIIIKQCEQLQAARLAASYSASYNAHNYVKRVRATKSGVTNKGTREEYAQLIQSMLTRYHHSCCYCNAPIDEDHITFDTILPLHLNHARPVAAGTKFYKLADELGLLGACCVACNQYKTHPEVAAMATWRWWRRGSRRFVPYGTPRERTPMPAFRAVRGSMSRKKWEPYINTIRNRLLVAGLRVASQCGHTRIRGAKKLDVEVAFDPAARALYFGCPDCSSGLVRIGFLRACE